ncbi:MAG: type II toxin-antitoxin system PemK/MazF family toxin [Chloroflexi bacterium]|nr:type II toxin-antitoxin system PemK/MazF family toxin [Chloroflexota bacterium]
MNLQTYRRWEVVLLSFPFAEVNRTRKRPGLVLLDTGDSDLVIARITSRAARTGYDVEIGDWEGAGLLLPSIARLDKLATLGKGLVDQRLGVLNQVDENRMLEALKSLWHLD